MFTHQAALVHVALHSVEPSLAGVLPDDVVAAVGQLWLLVAVHGNHQGIAVELSLQVLIIEIALGVDQGLLVVGLLHQGEHVWR